MTLNVFFLNFKTNFQKADQDDLPTQQLLDENPTPSATSPVINPNARDDDRKKALGKEEIEDTF